MKTSMTTSLFTYLFIHSFFDVMAVIKKSFQKSFLINGISLNTGLINVFNRRATGFHRQAKLYKLNSLCRKTFPRWSNQAGKIILTAGQFAWCLALNETPSKFMHGTSFSFNVEST